jgi:hypothetical protein
MTIQNDARTKEQKAADWDVLTAEIRRNKISEHNRLEQMIVEGHGEKYRHEYLDATGTTTTRSTGKWELVGINTTKKIDKILEEIKGNQ